MTTRPAVSFSAVKRVKESWQPDILCSYIGAKILRLRRQFGNFSQNDRIYDAVQLFDKLDYIK